MAPVFAMVRRLYRRPIPATGRLKPPGRLLKQLRFGHFAAYHDHVRVEVHGHEAAELEAHVIGLFDVKTVGVAV